MSLHDVLGLAAVVILGLGGLIVIIAAGFVLTRSGVIKGLKEAAEGWEVRADLSAKNLQDCQTAAAAAAAAAAEQAAAIAEQHRSELAEVRAELSTARERIAVLEAATDLTTVQHALEDQNRETATVRAELEAQKAVLHDALQEHNADAHARHEAIVAALESIAERLGR